MVKKKISMKLVELYIYIHIVFKWAPTTPSIVPNHSMGFCVSFQDCFMSYKNATYTHISTNGAPCYILPSCFKGAMCLLLFPQ